MAAGILLMSGSEAPSAKASTRLLRPANRPFTQATHEASTKATLRVKLTAAAAPPRWQQWFHRPLWLLPVAAVLLALFFSLAWSRGRSSAVQPQPTPEIPVAAKPDLRQEKEGDWPRPQPRTKRKLDKQAKPERKEPARAPDKKPSLLFDPNPMMALASLTAENHATIQHVERAQRLLRSFRNSSPVNATTFDLAYEKKQARQLVYQNILLRREAETRGDWPTEEMLSSLEPLLLDIGNLSARPTTDDVNPIKERMQKNEIVARLQLYATPVMVARAD